jgi:hypothetical protein
VTFEDRKLSREGFGDVVLVPEKPLAEGAPGADERTNVAAWLDDAIAPANVAVAAPVASAAPSPVASPVPPPVATPVAASASTPPADKGCSIASPQSRSPFGFVALVVALSVFVRRRAWLAFFAFLIGCREPPKQESAPAAPPSTTVIASAAPSPSPSPEPPPAAPPPVDSARLAELDALLRGVVPDGGIPTVAVAPGTPWDVYVEPAKAKRATLVEQPIDVQGKLSKDVVRRILRANFPRFRACYEHNLKRDPNLKGTVSARFIIDKTGAVESATLAGGTLTDPQMNACYLGVFRTLSFPEPEEGKVLVKYGVDFSM